MPQAVYPWKRFWYPREGQASLADSGFLLDPDSAHARYYSTDVVPFGSITDTPCLVLLGEPGIGKSTALKVQFECVREAVSGSTDRALWFDLPDFSSERQLERAIFEAEEVRQWHNSQSTLHLFLDTFDEALLQMGNISRVLQSGLRKLRPEGLRLRIASRPIEWQATLETGLVDIWGQPNVRILQLAPLRRVDVAVAAELSGIKDTDEFVRQVIGREVVPFAINPITLKMLIGVFEKGQALPDSRTKLYYEGCKRLCEEQNASRRDSPKARGSLLPGQLMAIAARVAAITQISRRSSIWLGLDEGIQPADAPLDSLVGGLEGEPPREFAVNLATIREALGTGLFSSKGLNRQGWQHQTYPEYLAAFYLNAHDLPPDRLGRLILHPDGSGTVIPQLRELAVWLAEMSVAAFQMLIRTDPETLMKSQMSQASNADRAALTKQLLTTFEFGGAAESLWRVRPDFARLNNPELASIIRPYLSDPARHPDARTAAIEIIRACGLADLQTNLITIALNPQEAIPVRVRAAAAIADIGDATSRVALRPLALGSAGNDPQDELKGWGLISTWPTHINAQELFSVLTPVKDDSLIGGYLRFLRHGIAKQLKPNDLAIAINWSRQHAVGNEDIDAIHKLATDILELATDHIDQPPILELLANALLERMGQYGDCVRITERLCAIGDEARRAVSRSMFAIASTSPHGAYRIVEVCALSTHDVPWLLTELSNSSSADVRRIIVELIARTLDSRDVGTFDEVLRAAAADKTLHAAIEPLVASVELETPEASQAKAHYELLHKKPKVVNPPVPFAERLSTILAGNNPEAFFHVWLLSHTANPGANDRSVSIPGWSGFDALVRTRIVNLACDYLKTTPSLPEGVWWKLGQFTNGMIAGSSALRLLAIHFPAALDELKDSDWVLWTKVILSYWDDDLTSRRTLIAKAYQHDKSTFLATLSDIIDGEDERYKDVFVIGHIAEFWSNEIASLARSKITNGLLNPNSFKKLLAKLLSTSDPEARAIAESAARGPIPSEGDGRRKAVFATAELLSNDPAEFSTSWPVFQASESFGVEVLRVIASEHEYDSFATSIPEDEVADICIWLSTIGAEKAEGDQNSGGLVTPAIALSHWWNALINFLAYKGTPSACDAIRKLIHALPQYEGLKYSLRQAEERMRQATWCPPLPEEVLRLTAREAGERLIISLHGIRTRGAWQKAVNPELQKNGFRHELLDYGYFLAVQLLLPGQRARKIDWFRDKYEKLVKENDRVPCVLAHSFGTYIVASAIEKYSEIRLDRIIFCGSIVRRDFDWDSLFKSGQVGAVLNEYGGKDFVVQLAARLVPGAGASGALGFESSDPGLYQRFRKQFRHSDYFYALNYRENWVPFLRGASPSVQAIERRTIANWRLWLLIAAVLLLILVCAGYFLVRKTA